MRAADQPDIIHVLPAAPFGGVQVIALQLAATQRDAGHRVELVYTNGSEQAAALAADAGLDATWLGPSRVRAAARLAAKVRTPRTIIHSHCEPSWASATLALTCARRWVVHLHGYPNSRRSLRKSAVSWIQGRFARFFIATSNSVRDVSIAEGLARPDRIHVAYNGLSLGAGPKEKAPREGTTIGYVGRIEPLKGIVELIDCADRLRDRDDIRFVVCGTGSKLEEAMADVAGRGLSEKVIFRGFVSDMEAVWEEIDVLAMLSAYESFGLVVIEAIGNGVAAIGYDNGLGSVEVLRQLPGGYLIDPADPDAFTRKIDELRLDPNAVRQDVARGAAIVRERFTLAAMERHVAAAYRRAFDGQPGLPGGRRIVIER